jgi:hypothetical protein
MVRRNLQNQNLHDLVVEASAQTYWQMRQQGYSVSTNPDGITNQFIGTANDPKYPDVIVWKPNAPGSNTGTAVIIEEIETEDSVNGTEVRQWIEYANLNVNKFILVVPASKAAAALDLIRMHQVRVSEIWYFEVKDRITFTKYISLF